MFGGAHSIECVLGPRYLGTDMTPEQRMGVEEIIYNQPTIGHSTTAFQEALFVEYTDFRTAALEMRRSDSLVYRMLSKKKISVLKFWISQGDTWPSTYKL